tara:strand:- start:44 stop:850 length:807 start_codon:yes stop_codon:yes gene_type:complete
MNSNDLKIYCVTNKKVNFIDKPEYYFSWVGDKEIPKNYIACDNGDNIYHKEKFYSELTFHYWYWKNLLKKESKKNWIGFCQKRRFWVKENLNSKISKDNINDFLITKPLNDWSNYDAIICNPIKVSGAKKTKIFKRGWRNILKDPSILFSKRKENILLHFDMHHGYGNLEKAITELPDNDRNDFKNYVVDNDIFNPHIMFIAKPNIIDNWFENLFPWLERCEKHFKFKDLKNYDTGRLFAYLAERYLSYWFRKNTIFKEENWIQLENF